MLATDMPAREISTRGPKKSKGELNVPQKVVRAIECVPDVYQEQNLRLQHALSSCSPVCESWVPTGKQFRIRVNRKINLNNSRKAHTFPLLLHLQLPHACEKLRQDMDGGATQIFPRSKTSLAPVASFSIQPLIASTLDKCS
jgi:hypothetical protein